MVGDGGGDSRVRMTTGLPDKTTTSINPSGCILPKRKVDIFQGVARGKEARPE